MIRLCALPKARSKKRYTGYNVPDIILPPSERENFSKKLDFVKVLLYNEYRNMQSDAEYSCIPLLLLSTEICTGAVSVFTFMNERRCYHGRRTDRTAW